MTKKILLLFLIGIPLLSAQEKMRFLMFTDIHYDSMPDAEERLRTIIHSAEKEKVDFMIELGDFLPPSPAGDQVKEILSDTDLTLYHVIGNHDVDKNDKQTYIDYWGLPGTWYTIDQGMFRLIILDSNHFIDTDDVLKPYDKGNYSRVPEEQRNRYGEIQLEWLATQLVDTSRICLIFSHAPVNDQYDSIRINQEVHEIITKARDNGTRIAGVFGGHIHSDNYHRIDGIHYIQVNSTSYIWGGSAFINRERYPEESYEKYSSLKYVIPYDKPLYAVIEVTSDGKLYIQGTVSHYVTPAPDPELLKTKPYPCSSIIENRALLF